jgi:hypothetical protein
MMTFSIAKLLFHSDGARTCFTRQGVLFVVAVALFALLWVTNVRGPGSGFVPVLLYTLTIGNLTTPIMNHLAPFSSRLRFPLDWIAYLTLLFVTAVAVVSLGQTIVMVLNGASFDSFFVQLWSTGKLVVVVILIVGSVCHLHEESRVRLEGKNLAVQRTVEIGNTRSQQQEKELDKAREIQEGLLPKKIPQVTGLEVAACPRRWWRLF